MLFLCPNSQLLIPVSLRPIHMVLTFPQTQQAHSCPRIFALATVSTGNTLPWISASFTPLLPSSHNSNITFSVRGSLSTDDFSLSTLPKIYFTCVSCFSFGFSFGGRGVFCCFCYHALECKTYGNNVHFH